MVLARQQRENAIGLDLPPFDLRFRKCNVSTVRCALSLLLATQNDSPNTVRTQGGLGKVKREESGPRTVL